jgi:two-component system, chemotaxis family, CheB/CheR fusion protein
MDRAPAGALRVLVVDDNADARKSLCWSLTLLGHTTQQADSGRAALETAARSLPDVMLLDIGMPGMAGYEVARQLRKMPDAEGVLLAAVTGHCAPEDIDRGRQAGFDVHLPKPMDLSMLEQLLRNHELTKH